jgi:Leucine-rich repeat (LRR) protein
MYLVIISYSEESIMSKSKLEDLPESFGNLTNLKILNLASNKLIKLPNSFGQILVTS